MKDLVEKVGKELGFEWHNIYNRYDAIDKCVSTLVKADLQTSIENILKIAIKYEMSLKIRTTYGDIYTYAEDYLNNGLVD